MYKAFGFLLFLVLFTYSSGQTIGQVTGNQVRPANATNTEANRLLQEAIELTNAGQLPQAVQTLEEAIKLDPHYAAAYAALGRAYFKMREWQKAVDNLHRAAALNAEQRQEKKNAAQQQSAMPKSATVSGAATLSGVTPVLVAQRTASEVTRDDKTQDEKTTYDVTLPKSATSASEEKPEPTGASVSTSASPISSTSASPISVERSNVSPISLEPSNEDLSLTKVYRVGPGDVLDVRINEAEPQQSTLFTVTSTGLLEHPLLAEPLNVSALTTEEIETKIADDLKKRALIVDPAVIVGIRDYASHTILVSGLVKESGTKFLRREAIPLFVVVADAQPLPEAARVTVVRNEQNQMFEIDLTNVADMRLLVRPGDVINLQRNETQFVYVGGEVKAPGEKIFRPGLTLMQAVLTAGGMTPKSKVAEIGRDDGRGFLVKTTFTLKDIQTGKAMDPLIRPGDRIMILR